MTEKCLESMGYAARRLNISEQRAYQLARQNLIPVIRLGRQLRVDPDELENFIRSGGQSLPGGWRKQVK